MAYNFIRAYTDAQGRPERRIKRFLFLNLPVLSLVGNRSFIYFSQVLVHKIKKNKQTNKQNETFADLTS